MPDTVTTHTIHNGARRHVVLLQSVSDGTGETAAVKIDKSGLVNSKGVEPDNLALLEVKWNIQGFTGVNLLWDHDTDDEMLSLSGDGSLDFTQHGALVDPDSTGGTGDVLLTTVGAALGDAYQIMLVFKLRD